MKFLLRLEEVCFLGLSFYLNYLLGYEWWMLLLFLFIPDVSMLGYTLGNKTGAVIYNIVHFKLLAIIVGFTGHLFSIPIVTYSGLILFAHSSLDRIFGYGLKYCDDFKNTHLGFIGKSLNQINKKNEKNKS